MSFINFSNIKAYIESKINVINTLTTIEASQVAVNAFQLARIGYAPSNLSALETYLSNKEAAVSTTDELKYITQLLGSSTPTKSVVWRMHEYLAGDTFTVPNNLAGDCVYVTGSGGGGSGAARIFITSGNPSVSGAQSGCYISKQPVTVSAGSAIPIVIGAGGAAVSVTGSATNGVSGSSGASSSFGSLVIDGGSGGRLGANLFDDARGGWIGGYQVSGVQTILPQNSIAYRAGRRAVVGLVSAEGSAAGAFGDGQDGVAVSAGDATATSAAANTGAGGGSAIVEIVSGTRTATSGAGGSGRIIVEWQEFL
jgi:hypothetical protein